MKILVLQLARLGDIYMSWPAMRALQRMHPGAEIHLMTRPRFQVASRGLEVVQKHILLPTESIMEPLLTDDAQIDDSISRLSEFTDSLKSENYDWIVNFSFSPVSSYLTHAISSQNTKVTGYTRHSDGYLNIADEVSSYFYAQVGINRENRIHLADLMATMIGADLQESDWLSPELGCADYQLPHKYIVIHIGASDAKKTVPAFKWARIIKHFHDKCPQLPVVLIGGHSEMKIGSEIKANAPYVPIIDLVGKTLVEELFAILKDASLLVGGDSAPMHVAGFTKTPCLNLSIGNVNFWETGPRAPKSYIYRVLGAEDIVSEKVATAMDAILNSRHLSELISSQQGIPSFVIKNESFKNQFSWSLIMAIYMGSPFPVTDDIQFCDGIEKLNDINNLAIEQLENINKIGLAKIAPFLDRADEVMEAISRIVPEIQIIVRWFQTERTRIPPGNQEEILQQTLSIHLHLKKILRAYLIDEVETERGEGHG